MHKKTLLICFLFVLPPYFSGAYRAVIYLLYVNAKTPYFMISVYYTLENAKSYAKF